MSRRTLRSLRHATVLIGFVAASLLAAAPARADVPEGWSDPEPVPPLEALLILAGIPILLIVAITAAVYVPALVRGERVSPGSSPQEHQWFGGPREGSRQLESGGGSSTADTGGASGRW
ncbi:MAG: hypothetical protein ACRDOM_08460 [Nocardioides sp.]